MPIISYIKECKAFGEFASEKRLNDNEIVLWHAFLNLFNQRATSNNWPENFIPLNNSKVLSMTPWGSGNAAVEKLRRTRDRLVQRGLIAYVPGNRKKIAPKYKLIYFHADETHGITPQYVGNRMGNDEGNAVGNNMGKGMDIKDKDGNHNLDQGTTHIVNPVEHPRAREGAAAWRPDTVARPGNYKQADGAMGKCRYDAGWQTSNKARGAIAQRLLDGWNGENDGENLWTQLCDLMLEGMPPELIEDVMTKFDRASSLLAHLNALYMALGYEAERINRNRNRQWAADLKVAGGDASLARRFQRVRGDDPSNPSE